MNGMANFCEAMQGMHGGVVSSLDPIAYKSMCERVCRSHIVWCGHALQTGTGWYDITATKNIYNMLKRQDNAGDDRKTSDLINSKLTSIVRLSFKNDQSMFSTHGDKSVRWKLEWLCRT